MGYFNFNRQFGGVLAVLAALTTACHGVAGPASGISFSGHVLADSQMVGAVNAPVCGAIAWFADRHQ